MSRTLMWASPLLLAAALAAQQGSPDSPPKAATAAERLKALKADQEKLVAEWRQQVEDAQKQAQEGKADGKPIKAMSMRPDFSSLVPKAQAAAAEFAGTDDAPMFLVFVLQSSMNQNDRIAALDTLTEKHRDHAAIAELGQMLQYLPQLSSPEKAKVYAERLAQSKNPDVRGWAMYVAHKDKIEKAAIDGDDYKSAKAELQKAVAEVTDAALKAEITGAISMREQLGVGNVAPDIVGQDLDGVPFKLSDYKGKVIFLDFWGDW